MSESLCRVSRVQSVMYSCHITHTYEWVKSLQMRRSECRHTAFRRLFVTWMPVPIHAVCACVSVSLCQSVFVCVDTLGITLCLHPPRLIGRDLIHSYVCVMWHDYITDCTRETWHIWHDSMFESTTPQRQRHNPLICVSDVTWVHHRLHMIVWDMTNMTWLYAWIHHASSADTWLTHMCVWCDMTTSLMAHVQYDTCDMAVCLHPPRLICSIGKLHVKSYDA